MQSLFAVDAHDGIDFAMPEGTEILATDEGEVVYSGNGLYGITVIVKHKWGNSYYGHLAQTKVSLGENVLSGQIIALSGSTGVSTGAHLHFGIRPNHFDPFNGYHGMIDPNPYLLGTVLGYSIQKHDLIHLPYKTIDSTVEQLSIPILASTSATLRFYLKNPQGDTTQVYPTIYNYGTGDTAILPRPTPFIPGEYILMVHDTLGSEDSISFSWGVVTLNTNQSRYIRGQTTKLELAVLDEVGEMVCDANLSLSITTPSGITKTLSTSNLGIITHSDVCQSKELTLIPDYEASYLTSEIGIHTLILTAITTKHTYTLTDTFEVAQSLPYTLERHTPTRIFPGNTIPVIFKLTPYTTALAGQFTEVVAKSFETTPLSKTSIIEIVAAAASDDSNLLYQRSGDSQTQLLTWDLPPLFSQPIYFGYSYNAPQFSPALYELGPAVFANITEARSWQIAVDSTDPTIGLFAPQGAVAWASAGNASLSIRQPDPKANDLMVAVLAIRPSSSTIDTPTGWTSLGSWTGTDGGAEGADTGSVRLAWFYKVADGTEGVANQTFTETGTTSVWIGNIFKARSSTGTYSVSAGGYSINADATNWGGTLDTDIGIRNGDLVYIAAAQNGD
ncbi:M23 family metallopeptidase [Candidatus Dojkabacteria bacterium]|uniref:M23 family metallopeptidase n=1 Tax=Candidatus Dojkabacteria bacterium TaxID=2099670 RepID=A0A5C7J5V3_9BACT|nr:MAG: M23 family metallopeptidase [Candidatus Dojkabacteria bacterium]